MPSGRRDPQATDGYFVHFRGAEKGLKTYIQYDREANGLPRQPILIGPRGREAHLEGQAHSGIFHQTWQREAVGELYLSLPAFNRIPGYPQSSL